jgi:hypothetical protein
VINTHEVIDVDDHWDVMGALGEYIKVVEQCTVIPRLTSDPANEFFG